MMPDEQIYRSIQQLPDPFREELYDFIQYLLMKVEKQERMAWMGISLASAMRGMETEETLYNLSDLKVVFE